MQINEMRERAAKLLGLKIQEAEEYSAYLPEAGALYLSIPIRGGASMLVAEDGTVLYADSSVSFDEHLEAFRGGLRTPEEAFSCGDS